MKFAQTGRSRVFGKTEWEEYKHLGTKERRRSRPLGILDRQTRGERKKEKNRRRDKGYYNETKREAISSASATLPRVENEVEKMRFEKKKGDTNGDWRILTRRSAHTSSDTMFDRLSGFFFPIPLSGLPCPE